MRNTWLKTKHFVLLAICLICLYGICYGSWDNGNNIHQNSDSKPISPVIFIPGLGGNKLQAKLNKSSAPHAWCSKKTDNFGIWLNFFEMFPDVIDCWVDNMKLTYNNVTRKTENTLGVEITPLEWGRTESIEWLDSMPLVDHLDSGAYFYYIALALTNRGYVRGQNLFGAPYDFRKGPNENDYWFERLVDLTEHAYNDNNNARITFIVHSLGGKMILYFLQKMPQTWKDQYVEQVISLSVPWGGSMQAIVAVSVGDNLNSKLLKSTKLKKVQETFPSIVWAMPSKNFWKPNEIIAIINNTNYTLENIDQFFNDIDLPNINEMRKDLSDYNNFLAPGVNVHCLFGDHIETVDSLDFGKQFNPKPSIIKGNGDGVVNERSLIGCKYWENTPAQENHKIYQVKFADAEHIAILGESAPINYILSKLTGHEDYPRANEQPKKVKTTKY